MSDANARNLAGQESFESIRFQASVLEAVGQAVIATDLSGRIVYWNHAAESMYGWSSEEVIGRVASEVLVSEDLHERAEEILSDLSRGNSWSGEFTLGHRNGEPLLVQVSNTPVYGVEGEMIGLVGVSTDITERKRIEEALRDSEKKFRTQYQGFPVPTYSWRRIQGDFILIDFNDAAHEFTNGRVADLLGRRASHTYSDQPELLEWLSRCYYEKTNITKEMWWTMKSTGETRYLLITVVFVPPNLVMVHTEDFTERRRAEDGLRESEERFRELHDATFEGIFIHDGEKILEANEALAAMSGYKKEELVGSTGLNFIAPEYRETVGGHIRVGSSEPYEVVGVRKDGTQRDLEVRGREFVYMGRPARLVSVRDVTERNLLEEDLRSTREFMTGLLDNAPLPIYTVSEEGRLGLVNRFFADFVQMSSEEVNGTLLEDAFTPDEARQFREINRRVMETEIPLVEEERAETREGLHYFQTIKFPLRDPGGRVSGIGGISFDITERKRMEEALHESREFLSSILENAPTPIYIVSVEGRMRLINQAYEDLFGVRREDVIGSLVEDIFPPEMARRFDEINHQIVEAGASMVADLPVDVPDGHHDLQVVKFPLRDPNGRVEAIGGIAVDVTERKRAEQELRESEEVAQRRLAELQTVYDTTPVGLAFVDRELRFSRVNEPLAEINGLSVADHLGRTVSEVLPVELADQVEPLYRGVIETGEPVTDMEVRGETYARLGDVRDWMIRLHPVKDAAGEVWGINILVQDVTERKRAEEALRESRERYRIIARATNDVIWEVDLATEELRWIGDVQRIFGYSTDEMQAGSWWGDRVHPEDRERAVSGIERMIHGGGDTWSEEYRFRFGDGSYGTVIDRAFVVRDDVGEPIRLIGSMLDVTERRRAEEALQLSEERFRKMYDTAFEGILIHDRDSILDINQTLADMLGYEKEELIGAPGLSFVAPEHVQQVREHFMSGSEEPYEGPALKKDGGRLDVEARGRNILYEGRPARLASLRDITDRKRAEAAMEASEHRLNLIYQNTVDSLFLLSVEPDERYRFVSVNDAFVSVTGLTREQIIDKQIEDVLLLPAHALVRAKYQEALRDDKTVSWEEVSVHPSGTHYGDARVTPMRDEATGQRYLVGSIRDITRLREEEEARRRADELYTTTLRENEERFRTLTDATLEALVISERVDDERSGIIAVNRAFMEMFGYEPEEVLGTGAQIAIAPESLDLVEENIASGYPEVYEAVGLRKDGTRLALEIRGRTSIYQGRRVRISALRDITERKRAEERLRVLAEVSRLFAEAGIEYQPLLDKIAYTGAENFGDLCGVWLLSEDGKTVESVAYHHPDPEMLSMLGEILSRPLEIGVGIMGRVVQTGNPIVLPVVIPEQLYAMANPGARPYLERLDIRGILAVPLRVRGEVMGCFSLIRSGPGDPYTPEDRELVEELTERAALAIDNALLYRAAQQEIAEREQAEERLEHQAFHDSLTGLPNRDLLADRLDRALMRIRRRDTSVAVLFADLDNFKAINDSSGHEMGDRLLVAVAERFAACLRPEDTLARFGGDELVVLLEEVESPTDAARVAERIAQELRRPFSLDGREVFTSASIGISLSDSENVSAEEMLRNADTAMYQTKRQGPGNYAVFEPAMYARVLRRLEMERDIRRAIEHGQLRLCYQPLVDLKSGSINGAEALVRWEHPERGLISPNEFISVAEETGLIVPLGKWVLEEACRQARAWQSEFPGAAPLTMSVNLSLNQFQRPDLIDAVAEILRQTGLEPSSLSLEITESVAMVEPEQAATMLRGLRQLGLRLAIDDFGTGHSSLSYLIKQFRVDLLKIDRTFISEIANDPEYETIISGIIRLAQNLNLEVVAEGIETAEQYKLLRSMGCDTGQGFLFSKPLTSEALSKLLSEHPRW